MAVSFATYYSYGYFAASITHGHSAAEPLNLLILLAQFVVPSAFFGFLCYNNLVVSRLLYDTILAHPHKLEGLTPE